LDVAINRKPVATGFLGERLSQPAAINPAAKTTRENEGAYSFS